MSITNSLFIYLFFKSCSYKHITWCCTHRTCLKIFPPPVLHLAESGILTKYVTFEAGCGEWLVWISLQIFTSSLLFSDVVPLHDYHLSTLTSLKEPYQAQMNNQITCIHWINPPGITTLITTEVVPWKQGINKIINGISCTSLSFLKMKLSSLFRWLTLWSHTK